MVLIVFRDLILSFQIRTAFFVLQAASSDIESQKQGIQLVIQISDPSNSVFLKDESTREKVRMLLACSPVRFSLIHVCCIVTSTPQITSLSGDVKIGETSAATLKHNCADIMASLLGRDERVRTKFHTGETLHGG
jgi:hypothetical protein